MWPYFSFFSSFRQNGMRSLRRFDRVFKWNSNLTSTLGEIKLTGHIETIFGNYWCSPLKWQASQKITFNWINIDSIRTCSYGKFWEENAKFEQFLEEVFDAGGCYMNLIRVQYRNYDFIKMISRGNVKTCKSEKKRKLVPINCSLKLKVLLGTKETKPKHPKKYVHNVINFQINTNSPSYHNFGEFASCHTHKCQKMWKIVCECCWKMRTIRPHSLSYSIKCINSQRRSLIKIGMAVVIPQIAEQECSEM